MYVLNEKGMWVERRHNMQDLFNPLAKTAVDWSQVDYDEYANMDYNEKKPGVSGIISRVLNNIKRQL